MLPSFANDTIIRIRPSTTTSRGSVIPDWSNVTEVTISGCSIQPATTSLSQDGRVLGIMDGMTAYVPPSADVQAGDRISFNGVTYTIDGAPRVWPTAGNLAHIQLNLRRWSG